MSLNDLARREERKTVLISFLGVLGFPQSHVKMYLAPHFLRRSYTNAKINGLNWLELIDGSLCGGCGLRFEHRYQYPFLNRRTPMLKLLHLWQVQPNSISPPSHVVMSQMSNNISVLNSIFRLCRIWIMSHVMSMAECPRR